MSELKIIMRLDPAARALLSSPSWPQGYRCEKFRDGDELTWAQVVTSTGEFDGVNAALEYWNAIFAPRPSGVFFAHSPTGPVGTATMWRAWRHGVEVPLLHWVSVDPTHQGVGLGRALCLEAISHSPPGEPIYLSTQASAAPAVWLYHRLGFTCEPILTLDYESVCGGKRIIKNSGNDFAQALTRLTAQLGQHRVAEIKNAPWVHRELGAL